MITPTARAILLAVAGAPLSLLVAAFAPQNWPLGLAWSAMALALVVADGVLANTGEALVIEAAAPSLAGVGAGPFNANVRVTFPRGRRPQAAEVALQTSGPIVAQPNHRVVSLEAGVGTASFTIEPRRRGEGCLERAFIRWRGPMGLAWRQTRITLDTKIALTPDLASVEREAERLFSRSFVHGIKPLRDRGDGSDFDALGKFQAGMDRRLIDWKQSARHQVLLAKEVRAERNHQIVFAIDTGRLMCEPTAGAPRIDWALNASLMLAYVGLRLGDRVSFFGFDARPTLSTGFVAGASAFHHLKALTARLDYSTEETNFTLGLSMLAEKLQRRSMVVVFTDFVDTIGAELMIENVARLMRRHLIVFVSFQDEELEGLREHEPEITDDISRAVVAHQLLKEREVVLARLRRMGATIVESPPDRLGSNLVRVYDMLRRQERV